jgi:hypothetical protein
MMDIKLLYQEDISEAGPRQTWAPIMQNSPGARAGVFVLWLEYPEPADERCGWAMNMDGNYRLLMIDPTKSEFYPEVQNHNEPWIRFIYTLTYTEGEGQWKVWGYKDGKPSEGTHDLGNTTDNTYPAYSSTDYGHCARELEIRLNEPLRFMTGRKGDKRYKGQYDLAALAVWDRALSDEEVATLGGISK